VCPPGVALAAQGAVRSWPVHIISIKNLSRLPACLPFTRWLASFVPGPVALGWPGRLRSCIGALIGIAFTAGAMEWLIGPSANIPWLVAPMGAAAVLLFAVPASPLAQPWSIIGGNLVSAVVGVACARCIADPFHAAAVAVALAVCFMFALRCVHPPSGAVALTAVLGGPAVHALGFGFVFEPIAIQSLALLISAVVFHALTGHRYPHAVASSTTSATAAAVHAAGGFTRDDIEAALSHHTELLDVDPGDLEALLHEVQRQVHARVSGVPARRIGFIRKNTS
jgi:CBS domain-containing membrane protein